MTNKTQPQRSGGRYPNIAARVFDRPLLIEQSKLNAILHVLGPRLEFDTAPFEGTAIEYATPEKHMAGIDQIQATYEDAGYFLTENGTGIIPIIGTLIQRGDWMSSMSGMLSYQEIGSMFAAAMKDYRVKSIVMEIDSPGGEVAGAFDMADMIYNARGEKPITAVATEFAASAAYLIASAADEIVLPRTGSVGSIGVVSAHFDYSKMADKKGIAVTYIYAGDKKVDGNPFTPLSDSVKAEWQAEIDSLYSLFADTVARNRGLSADHVKGTQAGMFMGFKAVDSGLADRVNTLGNELSNSALRQGGPFHLNQEKHMEPKANAGMTHSAADVEAARQAGHAAGVAEGSAATAPAVAAAVTAERGRVNAILTHAEAADRTALASHLALETDTPAEAAVALLAKAPKQAAQSRLGPAMETERPNVTGQEGSDKPAPAAAALSFGSVYANRAQQVAVASAKR